MPGGEENGQRGYMLTYVIAYLRVRSPQKSLKIDIAQHHDDIQAM